MGASGTELESGRERMAGGVRVLRGLGGGLLSAAGEGGMRGGTGGVGSSELRKLPPED